jgi:Na+/melibiose symporter-like transporter
MLILPLIAILLGYIVYLKKFKIDEDFYRIILNELKSRGDIGPNG